MRGADRVSSFVLVVFALVAVNEARKLRLGSLGSPGPGFVPLCLAVALALVGMILLWHALRERESPVALALLNWKRLRLWWFSVYSGCAVF